MRSLFVNLVHSVAQSMSNSATPWVAACQASLSITSSQSLLRLMPIESVMPSNHLILCRPLLSFCSCTCFWGLGLVLDRKISLPHWDLWVCFEFLRGVWEDISWKMGSFVLQIQKILAEDNVVGKKKPFIETTCVML